jgi:TonB family protein
MLGVAMNIFRPLFRLAILSCLSRSLYLAQTRGEPQSASPGVVSQDLPKNHDCPAPPEEGQVIVSVTIDSKGNVSQAKALSGRDQLIASTLACAKAWKYDPPASAPVTKTVSVSYDRQDCPGAISDRGDLRWSWVLRDQGNQVVAILDGQEPPAPPYPVEERKAGKAGRMVLHVNLNAEGYITEIHAVRSLSPGLDQLVIERLRLLKFKLRPDINSKLPMDHLYFVIAFHATCLSQTLSNIEPAR